MSLSFDVFDVLFCSLFSLFLRGMLHLGYAGFISTLAHVEQNLGHLGCCCILCSPCWANVDHVGLSLCGPLLHQNKAVLAHVGQMLGHVGICQGNVGTIFHI